MWHQSISSGEEQDQQLVQLMTSDPTADPLEMENFLSTSLSTIDDPGTGPSLTGPQNTDGTLDAPSDETGLQKQQPPLQESRRNRHIRHPIEQPNT